MILAHGIGILVNKANHSIVNVETTRTAYIQMKLLVALSNRGFVMEFVIATMVPMK